MALPARPLLAPHARARRHFRDGEEAASPGGESGSVIMIFDAENGGVVEVGEAAWTLLGLMDGTRDLEGIRSAASHRGVETSVAAIQTLLSPLVQAGLVIPHDAPVLQSDGPAMAARSGPPDASLDLPVVALAGFRMHCDGRGSCCRLYGTVLFTSLEEAQARTHLPLLRQAGQRPRDVFTPAYGVNDDGPRSVAFSGGRCIYLHDDGACRIHTAGGAEAKPHGCRLFPTVFVNDGTELRISVAPECACVLRSATEPTSSGSALIPATIMRSSDLDPEVVVDIVPEDVVVDASGSTARRAEYLKWSAALDGPISEVPGLLEWLWIAADAFPSLPVAADVASVATQMVSWLDALSVRAFRQVAEDAAWRASDDLARAASRWIAQAALTLTDRRVLMAVLARPTSEAERFYVRALTFGHAWALGRPVAVALRDHAVRVVVARALSLSFTDAERNDPVTEQPLALVEAMLRGHGLADYTDALMVTA